MFYASACARCKLKIRAFFHTKRLPLDRSQTNRELRLSSSTTGHSPFSFDQLPAVCSAISMVARRCLVSHESGRVEETCCHNPNTEPGERYSGTEYTAGDFVFPRSLPSNSDSRTTRFLLRPAFLVAIVGILESLTELELMSRILLDAGVEYGAQCVKFQRLSCSSQCNFPLCLCLPLVNTPLFPRRTLLRITQNP